jgi:hypothetical protein
MNGSFSWRLSRILFALFISIFSLTENGGGFGVSVGVSALVSATNTGTYAVVDDIEFIYQIPSSATLTATNTAEASASSNIKGFMIYAHGCGHSALDWWPQSSSCPTCKPLPAETYLVDKSVSRGLVTIAISSPNRKHKCWHLSDKAHVLNVLQHVKGLVTAAAAGGVGADSSVGTAVVTQHNNPATITTSTTIVSTAVNQLPVYIFGVSSGGVVAAALAEEAKVAGAVLQISYLHQISISSSLSPILFHHMKKDFRMSMSVRESTAELKAANVPTKALLIEPKPLLDTFAFYNVLQPSQRVSFINGLQAKGLVNKEGYLLEDPRHMHREWHAVASATMPDVVPTIDALVADESPISEVMNIAFASHEISGEGIDEVGCSELSLLKTLV